MRNYVFPGLQITLAFVFIIATVLIFGCNSTTSEPPELLEVKHENVVKVFYHNHSHSTIMKKVEDSKEIIPISIYADKIKYFADVAPGKPMWAMVRITKVGGNTKNADIHVHENFQLDGGNSTVGIDEQGHTSVVE